MTEPKSSRWGSLLSGAVAGIESRLDTILADDNQTSARQRAEDNARKQNNNEELKPKVTKTNDRLAARLAKAVKTSGEITPSETPSRNQSPFPNGTKSRNSIDTQSSSRPQSRARQSTDLDSKEIKELQTSEFNSSKQEPNEELAKVDEISTTTVIDDAEEKLKEISEKDETTEKDVSIGAKSDQDAIAVTVDQDLALKHKEQSEEIHRQLEKIDRLHSNINYLSAQLLENSKDNEDNKDADKDAKIAQLLKEGGDLSKVEEKLRGDIKYLRVRLTEEKQTNTEVNKKLDKLETEVRSLKVASQAAESREKSANERLNALHDIQRELGNVRIEKNEAIKESKRLQTLLEDAERRADDADKKAQSVKLEQQKKIISDLQDEISNAKIERKLIEDRLKNEVKEIKAEHNLQLETLKVNELELKAEIQGLEAKLEILRLQTEEISTNSGGDSQAKLLRQIETLQSQYTLASDNWQGIESGLNTRITTLEKDRDELAKREADARKKFRDMNSKAKRLEEEIEAANDDSNTQESEIAQLKAAMQKSESRLKSSEKMATDAREDLARERREFEGHLQTRLEEERIKYRAEFGSGASTPAASDMPNSSSLLHREFSNSISQRKFSGLDINSGSLRRSQATGSRFPNDLSLLMPSYSNENAKSPNSRRSINSASFFAPPVRTPTDQSLNTLNNFATSGSGTGPLNTPPPIIPVADDPPQVDMDDSEAPTRHSPHRTAAEMVSVSTSGAGPSVQLVERMSASVRRLEMEKAAAREEISRLGSQRDEARDEVVSLMREAEGVKNVKEQLEKMQSEFDGLKGRYEAALEMLGEKSEECEELRNDVMDIKKIYRELVESTLST